MSLKPLDSGLRRNDEILVFLIYGFDLPSRHPSLSTGGILRLSERCLSEASFANAQNTGERKEPRKARRGIRVAFSLVPFLLATQKK